MYRRNITHILASLTLVLVLFVGYHAWLKPHYFPEQPSPPSPSITEEASVRPPQTDEPSLIGAKRTRTIDPATMPAPSHMEALSTINDELEKGNAAQAEAKLADIPASALTDRSVRRHVAVLWNNLGIVYERTSGTEASLKAFKKATSLDPDNPTVMLNLAHAYWGLRDSNLTVEFLTKLITLAPDEAFPHLALADLLQEQDKLAEAGRHLRDATTRIKKDPALQSYLKAVTAKVQRIEHIEDKLAWRSSVHFIVKFDGTEDQATWTEV